MFLKIILLCLIGIMVYCIIDIICAKKVIQRLNEYMKKKDDKYYKEYIRNYEKMKKIKLAHKLNIIHKINMAIERTELRRNVIVNPITIILLSMLCVAICYIVTFKIFKMVLLSVIISIPIFLLPMAMLNYMGTNKEEKMEKTFLNFLLQLKNYIKINKDIVGAFKDVQTVKPLSEFIKRFVIEIESGMRFEDAIENLKEKIRTEKFREFFSNLKYCYIYGGDIVTLIDKSYKQIETIQKEKLKRLEETKGARIVLFILISLNIFVYITYINKTPENYMIMRNTSIRQCHYLLEFYKYVVSNVCGREGKKIRLLRG